MMMNRAKFLQNGNCGYILKPKFMMEADTKYNLGVPVEAPRKITHLTLKLISGSHLPISQDVDAAQIFVSIRCLGHPEDDDQVWSSSSGTRTGLFIKWSEESVFNISYPELAFIEFAVKTRDTLGAEVVHGVYMISAPLIRKGFRTISLENKEGRKLSPSSLLVHCKIETQDMK